MAQEENLATLISAEESEQILLHTQCYLSLNMKSLISCYAIMLHRYPYVAIAQHKIGRSDNVLERGKPLSSAERRWHVTTFNDKHLLHAATEHGESITRTAHKSMMCLLDSSNIRTKKPKI